MRNFFTSIMLLLAASSVCGSVKESIPVMNTSGVMKAMPIYSNDLIDKAPEGEVVTGIRDCYSCYFQGGVNYRDFEKGVAGEYVLGADGNVYLRAVCYSASKISSNTDTYLKLEKVDETTYVAHTPQLIWVDNSSDSPFTAYATRVEFTQKSATSFGYEVPQKNDGTYDTDVFFTLKDGKLVQKNQNTIQMNDETFPEELIGFTSSTGGWIGFGDGCIQICPPAEPTTLPEGAVIGEKSMRYSLLHVRDVELNNASLLKYAEVGDEIYISNPSAQTSQWIKGTIDREKGTATFLRQYLGIDSESGYAVWFIPAEYDKYIDVLNEETGFGEWFRNYKAIDKLVLDYANGACTSHKGEAICFSHSPETILLTGVYADPVIKNYSPKSTTPASATFTKFEPMDDMWGFGVIGFAIPNMDKDGVYIQPDELYYNVFPDDSTTPFVFSPDDYYDMQVEPMTDVPNGYYEDFDFRVSGINHTVYFYHDWKKVGVQVVQKHAGEETRSDIVYTDNTGGVTSIATDRHDIRRTYKYFENGKVIIVHDGIKYNILGQPVNE